MALSQEQKDALDRLRKRDGTINTDAVIKAAKNPNHPLHGEFNWDIEQAAYEHWTQVARRILREYKLVITVTNRTLVFHPPAYVRDPSLPGDQPGYKSTAVIKTKQSEVRQSLTERARTCLGHLTTLRDLCVMYEFDSQKVDLAINNINDFIQSLQSARRGNFPVLEIE